MITKQMVSDKLLAYLNEEISLAELVDWAENCFVIGGFGPDEDIPVIRIELEHLLDSVDRDMLLRSEALRLLKTRGYDISAYFEPTASSRATIERLRMNREPVVLAREKWVRAGWHPPA